MSTTAQTLANRENATHSTGPTTPAGKSTSSQNSLQHGLASSQIIIMGESQAAFDASEAALLAEHLPATPTETTLVKDMAKHHWLADRAIRLQNQAIQKSILSGVDIPHQLLGLLIRYQTTNERAFHKSLSTLLTNRKHSAAAAIGFASQKASAKDALDRTIQALLAPTPGDFLEKGWQPGAVDVETGEFTPQEPAPSPIR